MTSHFGRHDYISLSALVRGRRRHDRRLLPRTGLRPRYSPGTGTELLSVRSGRLPYRTCFRAPLFTESGPSLPLDQQNPNFLYPE